MLFPAIDINRRQFQPMFQSIADNRNQYHWFIGREIPCDIYWNRNHQFFPCLIQTGGSCTNSSCLFRYERDRIIVIIKNPPVFILVVNYIFSFLCDNITKGRYRRLLHIVVTLPIFLYLSYSCSFHHVPTDRLSMG